MLRFILLPLVLILEFHNISAQQISANELGFQEFTATISSSVGDESGNIYYAGVFKGDLRVNGQVLAEGVGGNDIFLLKINNAGTVIWHKTFGSDQDQSARSLSYLNGSLYLSYITSDSLQVGAIVIAPYPNGQFAFGVSKFNAGTGDIIWSHRTNISPIVVGSGSDLRYYAPSSSFVRWDDRVLLDSVGGSRQVFLHLDTTSGDVQSIHRVSTSAGSVTLQHVEQLSPSKLFLSIRAAGTTSLSFDTRTITLPSVSGQHLFINIDSSFSSFNFRIMNPGSTVPFQFGYTRNNLTFSPARDSIYFIANSNSSGDNVFYSLDGLNISLFRKNLLVVLDTQFITRKATIISAHPTAQNAIQYKSIATIGNDLYLLGQVFGNNQAPPIIAYPENVVSLNLLPNLTDTFNLEGPSRSFIIKTNSSFANPRLKWLGTHTIYETSSVGLNYLTAFGSRLSFSHSSDNIWNPWVVDSSLQIIRGEMKANADRAETIQNVHHLSDGSLIIAGNSHGKTALDSSYQGLGMGGSRKDLFLVRRSPGGTILWYKRLYSSFTNATINRFFVQNDKIYVFLVMYTNTNRLGYNYLRLDTTTLIASSTTQSDYRVLLVIQSNGTSRLIPLDDNLPTGKLASVDIYPNGDIAAISFPATIGMQLGSLQYPGTAGFYMMRLDSSGVVKKALKVYRATNLPVGIPALQMGSIRVQPADSTLVVTGLYGMLSGQPNHLYFVHNGVSVVDTIQTINYNPTSPTQSTYAVLLNTDLQTSLWESVLSPAISLNGPQGFEQVASNLFFTFSKSQTGPLLINGQVVSADTLKSAGVISLNRFGGFRAIKTWRDTQTTSPFVPTRLKSIASNLYVSGSINRPAIFDTISVSAAGYSDALTIKYDTNLVARQSHRLATRFYETMYDISIFQDSVFAFAYTAQQSPAYFANRIAGNPLDLEQNAFLGSFTISRPLVPFVPVPKTFLLYPNPNTGSGFYLVARNGVSQNYTWRLFDVSGRFMDQGTKFFSGGIPVYFGPNKVLAKGAYFLFLVPADGVGQELIRFLVIK